MTQSNKIPCVTLPKAKKLKITLPFGQELKALSDPSKGPPTDCALVHSLMLQLMPALASMDCFFKVLKVVQSLEKLKDIKSPQDAVTGLVDVATAAGNVLPCFAVFANIPIMIVDILRLIVAYLKCIIEAVNSVLKFRVGIDLNSAQGNPVLLASLNCAQDNADISIAQLTEVLAVIKPLLEIMKELMKSATAQLPGPANDALNVLPDGIKLLEQALDSSSGSVGISGTQEITKKLDDLKNTLEQLQESLDALP
jgi:hypothetical protein